MPATWATASTSPLRAAPVVISLRVAGARTTSPRATASHAVSGFSPTSTIRARPRRSRCVSRRGRRSMDTLLVPAPVRFPELALHDLAGPRFGQAFPELHRGRHFEARQGTLAVRHDVLGGRGPPRLEHDQGLRSLTPPLVWDRDHGTLEDSRVRRKHLFDLHRVDVLAAADDDVRLAVDDRDVALLVHNGHVPGVEPSVADRLRGRLCIAIIPIHHN